MSGEKNYQEKARSSHGIVDHYSKLILSGEMKPGEKLPSEGELCHDFSVSRTVIREGIQNLKASGIIKTINGKGSYVAECDLSHFQKSLQTYCARAQQPSDWFELLALRVMIEAECVRELTVGQDLAKIAGVETCLNTMRNSQLDLDRFAIADIDFHQSIVQASGNKLFAAVWGSLRSRSLEFALATYQRGEQVESNLKEHENIFAAIQANEVESAVSAMQSHLKSSKRNLQALV